MSPRPEAVTAPGEVKSCCATAYSSDLVAALLGDSYHPGGLALTRVLARAIDLRVGDRVLDVAAGRGATALTLAQRFRVTVDGVDLSDANVARATAAAAAADVADRARFRTGDAERLPFGDGVFDAVVCECAFCTFPDKVTAAAELSRVLRPGGRVGITDVVVDTRRLPAALTSLASWVACIADARPVEQYADILAGAGLRVMRTERHDRAMLRMIEQLRARIDVLRMTSREHVEALGLDFARAGPVLDTAEAAARDGVVGYALLTAQKPRSHPGRVQEGLEEER